MTQSLRRGLRFLVIPTITLIAIGGFAPGRLTPAVRIYALFLCAVALGLALTALRRAYPRTRPLRPRAKRGSTIRRPPPTLGRLEQQVALGVASAFELHFRLVPHVRSIASGLLSARQRVSIDEEPEVARRLLGPYAWELVRADRPSPVDQLARGLSASDLRRVVESLERI